MRRLIGLALTCLLLAAPAFAQSTVSPTGQFTPGHALRAANPGGTIFGDGGGAAGSSTYGAYYLTEIGITNTGTPFCINDALINNPGGYHSFCLGANSNGAGVISFNAHGAASALPFDMILNGTTYQFPFVLSGIVGPSTTTVNDIVCWNNTVGTLVKDCPLGNGLTMISGAIVTGPGVPSFALNTQIANYTIASTDCGKLIQAGTGSTGQFAVGLPSAGSVASNCVIDVLNGDTAAGKILQNFPAWNISGILYPLQEIEVGVVNGAWAILVNPGKWKPLAGGVPLYVNPSGSDTNDCLATGASRACASINTAIKRWYQDIDCSVSAANVDLDVGSHSNDLTGVKVYYAANCGTPNSELHINGTGGHTAVTVFCNASTNCFDVEEPATLALTGVTITTNGNGATGMFIRQGATGDAADVAFTAFPLGTDISVTTNGHFNQTGPLYVSGSAGTFLSCNIGSYCSYQGNTTNVAGGLTFTLWIASTLSSVVDSSAGETFTGAGAGTGTTGTQCGANYNSAIRTGGSTFPGTASTCGSGQANNSSYIGNF